MIFQNMFNSPFPTVKSRSLKSILTLVEKEQTYLDTHPVFESILRCSGDNSPLVRQAALDCLARLRDIRPSIESKIVDLLVYRTNDASKNVARRAIELSKEIYLSNKNQDTRALILSALLKKVEHQEEDISKLVLQTFKEVLFSPLTSKTSRDDPIKKALTLKKQASLIVRMVRDDRLAAAGFESLFLGLTSKTSAESDLYFSALKSMVAVLFDGVIDPSELPGQPPQSDILRILSILAKSNPKLFEPDQMPRLKPYIENLDQNDDLLVYRYVVMIFTNAFPHVAVEKTFVKQVQDALLNVLGRQRESEIRSIVECLATIDIILNNTDRLVRVHASVITSIKAFLDGRLDATVDKMKRFMTLAGAFGQCNFVKTHTSSYLERMKWWKGSAILDTIAELLYELTKDKHQDELRLTALDNICLVSRTWPRLFLREDVSTALKLVFVREDDHLKQIALDGILNFLVQEEKRSESGAEYAVGENAPKSSERFGKSLQANENDGVGIALAQIYLTHVTDIALSRDDELALAATRVIGSISRQGLLHPKECASALIALETSKNADICDIAAKEHKRIYNHHESVFEKEHIKAIERSYEYQKRVYNDPHGAIASPYLPKLSVLFKILTENAKKVIRKKFLVSLCTRIDFELPNLKIESEPPECLVLARFILENVAFYPFEKLDELVHLLTCMESIFTTTGASVDHAIQVEILNVKLEPGSSQANPTIVTDLQKPGAMIPDQSSVLYPTPFPETSIAINGSDVLPPEIELPRLRQLTAAAAILTLFWETRTFLRRLWGVERATARLAQAPPKAPGKETTRSLTKSQGVHPERYYSTVSSLVAKLEDPEKMRAQCKAFTELMSVDSELKVGDGNDEDLDLGYDTPPENEALASLPGSGKGRKRKADSISGTPRKRISGTPGKRGRPRKKSLPGSDDEEDFSWD